MALTGSRKENTMATIPEIQAWLAANPNATPTQVFAAAALNGFTSAQMAEATGHSVATVEQAWKGAGVPVQNTQAQIDKLLSTQPADIADWPPIRRTELRDLQQRLTYENMPSPSLQDTIAVLQDAGRAHSNSLKNAQAVLKERNALTTLSSPTATPAQIWQARNIISPPKISTESDGDSVAQDILAIANANAIQNTPEWQAVVIAYNTGNVVPEAYRPLLNRLNGYFTDGAAAPGNLLPEVAGQALSQWARDAAPGGFDRVMNIASSLVLTYAFTVAGMPAWAAAATSSGVQTLGTGGSLGDAVKNAAMSGAFAWGGQQLGDFSKGWVPSGWDQAAKDAAQAAFGGAGIGAATAIATGESPLEGALMGAAMSGLGSLAKSYLLPSSLGGTGGGKVTNAQLNELTTSGLTNEQVKAAAEAWKASGELTPDQSAWADSIINTAGTGVVDAPYTELSGIDPVTGNITSTVINPNGTQTVTTFLPDGTTSVVTPGSGITGISGVDTGSGQVTNTDISDAGQVTTTNVTGGNTGGVTDPYLNQMRNAGYTNVTSIDPKVQEELAKDPNWIDKLTSGADRFVDANQNGVWDLGEVVKAVTGIATAGGVITDLTGGGGGGEGTSVYTGPGAGTGTGNKVYTGSYAQSGIAAATPGAWSQPLSVDPATGIVAGYGAPEQTYFTNNLPTNYTGQGVYTPPPEEVTYTPYKPEIWQGRTSLAGDLDLRIKATPGITAPEFQQFVGDLGGTYDPITGLVTGDGVMYHPPGAPRVDASGVAIPQYGPVYPGKLAFDPTTGKVVDLRFTEASDDISGLVNLSGGDVTVTGYAEGGAVRSSGLTGLMPHLIQGDGDGLSDEVPAYIDGMGQQEHEPIRVADGEYIIPSDVVSGIGNGSTDAGAKVLNTLVARVRKERTGSKKPAKKVNAQKIVQSV